MKLQNKVNEKIKNPQIIDFINNDLIMELTPVNAVSASGTLTMDTQPTAGNTLTIGTKVYTFTADGTADADGEIDVGADLADAKALVVAAINGSDNINTAHPQVTAAAFTGDDMVITAITKGTAGNSIATTETFTEGTNVWAAATLGSGVNGTLGSPRQIATDATHLYICGLSGNEISGNNWRRISKGSAY